MCGRARCTLNQQQIGRACGIQPDSHISTTDLERFRPSYNVSPGAYLPVVVQRDGGREIQCMKWGLVPEFTKKTEKPDHYRMFNARSESINEKASFRRLLPKNRCLVAVEGFYEWKKDGSKKQPYYIHFKDQRPIVFASLYDTWTNSEGEILYTFTILTTCSSSSLQWIHDRMPVILGNNASIDEWLDPLRTSKFDSGLGPYEGSDLVWHSVTPAMGKASFDDPECIKELNPVEKNPISKFFSKKKIDQLSYGDRIENIVKEEAGISGIIKEHSSDDSFDKKCPKIFSDSEIKMDDQLFVADKDEEQVKKDKCSGRIKKKECGVKRNYDVNIPSRSEHTAHFVNKTMESMSKKKKASIKTTTVGDGQSTLLSFFKKNHP